jgi:hypothetical protein
MIQQKLKDYLNDNNMTGYAFAKMYGFETKNVYNWISGKIPNGRHYEKLIGIL